MFAKIHVTCNEYLKNKRNKIETSAAFQTHLPRARNINKGREKLKTEKRHQKSKHGTTL